MRNVGVAAVAVAVVAAIVGGGYYGIAIYPSQRFHRLLDDEIARFPPGFTASYKSAQYSIVSHVAVVTGLAVHGTLPGTVPQDFDATVDEIDLVKPNLDFGDAWSAATANPAALTRETMLPVADRIAAKGYRFRLPTVSGGTEGSEITGLRLYPWGLLHDGVPSFDKARAAIPRAGQPPQLGQLLPLLKFEAAVGLAVAYDEHSASNMKLTGTVPATPSSPATEFVVTIGKISGGYDRGIMRRAAMTGMAMDLGKLGSFTVERFAMADLALRDLLTRFVSDAAPSPAMLDGLTLGGIEYAGMTMKTPVVATPLVIGTISLDHLAFAHGAPVSGAFTWHGLRIERAAMTTPQSRAGFDTLGLDAMTFGLAVAYDWDVEHQRLKIHDTALKIDELGTLALDAEIVGVVPATLNPNAQLAHARLRFADASLIDRWLRTTATRAHADPEAVRRQTIAALPQQAAALGGGNPAIADFGQVLADFLAAPRFLTIDMAPPKPLPMTLLPQLGKLSLPVQVQLLGLTLTANE